MNTRSQPMRHLRRHGSEIAAASLALLLSTGCGSTDTSIGNRSLATNGSTGESDAIQATYVLTFPGEEDYRVLYEVLVEGDDHVRVNLTVPSDVPVTVYRWVWDGHQVLEFGDDFEGSYTLYEAPGEDEGLLDFLSAWVMTPGSDEFLAACPDAQQLDATKGIAGRTAIGFSCSKHSTPRAEVWIDQATHLLLGESGVPSESSDDGVLRAEEVTIGAPTDATTFSTEPPPDKKVDVIEATG